MSRSSLRRIGWTAGLGSMVVLAASTASAQWYQLGADINGVGSNHRSGRAVSLSADGNRVAIGSPGASSDAGHVRVFERSASPDVWVQLGPNIDDAATGDQSGYSVSISADGSRVAVGAPTNDDNGNNSGHVRVYEWVPTLSSWVQAGSDLPGEDAFDSFGGSVALSSDGHRVAVGAAGNAGGAGHVRVFRWVNPTWVQLGPDIEGQVAGDNSGSSVSLSADGSRVAIGAPFNGGDAGHVRVYEWFNLTSTWLHVGQDIDGEAAGDNSGSSVSLSADGSRVAVGAPNNDGLAGSGTGHVRVYEYASPVWERLGLDIEGQAQLDHSGFSVSLSADGSRVAVGSPDGFADNRGHVRIFEWFYLTSSWLRVGSVIGGEDSADRSGFSVALSPDGDFVAIGAPLNDDNGVNSGHVRLYSSLIFADGFESGGTSLWSAVVPGP